MLKEYYEYGIGNTPIIELPKISGNRIILKLEMENFLKSIKARTAYWMIKNLPPYVKDKTIVESSSGNLGYALGYFCKENNFRFLCLIDKSITEQKKNRLIEAGIEYICVKQEDDYDLRTSRIRQANRMMESGQYYWVNQYDNLYGIMAHEQTTGPEIWKQTEGTGLYGKPGNIARNSSIIDESFIIEDRNSIYYAKELQTKFGLNVGISTGMAYAAALQIAEKDQNAVILVVAPDGGDCYEEYFTNFV